MGHTEERLLPAGTRVRYDGLVDGGPKYGILVHSWWSDGIGGVDCYVAFFGGFARGRA